MPVISFVCYHLTNISHNVSFLPIWRLIRPIFFSIEDDQNITVGQNIRFEYTDDLSSHWLIQIVTHWFLEGPNVSDNKKYVFNYILNYSALFY